MTDVAVKLGVSTRGDERMQRGRQQHVQLIAPLLARGSAADPYRFVIDNAVGYDWMIALLHVTAETGAQIVTQNVYPYSVLLDDYTELIVANGLMDEPDTFADTEVQTPWTTVFKYVFGPGASDSVVSGISNATWNGARDFVSGPLPERFVWRFTHSTTNVLTWGIDCHLGFGTL